MCDIGELTVAVHAAEALLERAARGRPRDQRQPHDDTSLGGHPYRPEHGMVAAACGVASHLLAGQPAVVRQPRSGTSGGGARCSSGGGSGRTALRLFHRNPSCVPRRLSVLRHSPRGGCTCRRAAAGSIETAWCRRVAVTPDPVRDADSSERAGGSDS